MLDIKHSLNLKIFYSNLIFTDVKELIDSMNSLDENETMELMEYMEEGIRILESNILTIIKFFIRIGRTRGGDRFRPN